MDPVPNIPLPTPANFAELPAIRCRTCGKVPPISRFRDKLSEGETREEAFELLGLKRNCCRRAITHHPLLPAGVAVDPKLLRSDGTAPKVATSRINSATNIINISSIPPIEVDTRVIGEHGYIDIEQMAAPKEITMSRQGKLISRYINYDGNMKDILAIYNDWIQKVLPEQIRSHCIYYTPEADGRGDWRVELTHEIEDLVSAGSAEIGSVMFTFDNTHIKRPTKSVMVNRDGTMIPCEQILFPSEARRKGINYFAGITIDVKAKKVVSIDGGLKLQDFGETGKIKPGMIPVMKRSVACNLYGLSDDELLRHGECPSDPGGYFGIGFQEYVILIQEKLRFNIPITYAQKPAKAKSSKTDGVVMRFTASDFNSTSVVEITRTLDTGVVPSLVGMLRIRASFMGNSKKISSGKQRSINPFIIWRIFMDEAEVSVDTIIDNIERFIQPEDRTKVRVALAPTAVEYEAIKSDPFIYAGKYVESLDKIDSRSFDFTDRVKSQYLRGLFIQMNDDPNLAIRNLNKLNLLSMLLARFIQQQLGIVKLNDRDDWGYKQMQTAGIILKNKWKEIYKEYLRSIVKDISNTSSQKPEITTITSHTPSTDATAIKFAKAFTSNWSVRGKSSENVTEILDRKSLADTLSHLNRLRKDTSKRNPKAKPRLVDATQVGYVDVAEAPESNACGLVNNRSIGCRISPSGDENLIFEIIKSYISQEYSAATNNAFVLNGKFKGWCDARKLYRHLKTIKTGGSAAHSSPTWNKVSIFIDEKSNKSQDSLWVYNDNSRPTRALFIVGDDGNLVIDQKNLWGSPWSDLLAEGCIEYIDPTEQNIKSVHIAPNMSAIKSRQSHIDGFLGDIVKYEGILESLENFDPSSISETDIATKDYLSQVIMNRVNNDGDTTARDRTNIDEIIEFAKADLTSQISKIDKMLKDLEDNPYKYMEIDPQAILGQVSAMNPFVQHNQAPRNMYACQHTKQSGGIAHSNQMHRFDTKLKSLAMPERAYVETEHQVRVAGKRIAAGQMIRLAIGSFMGYNQEDAIVMNRSSIDRGLFLRVVYRTFRVVIKGVHGDFEDTLGLIDITKRNTKNTKSGRDLYHAIDPSTGLPYESIVDPETGLPRNVTLTPEQIKSLTEKDRERLVLKALKDVQPASGTGTAAYSHRTRIRVGDCVIGIKRVDRKTGIERDISQYASFGEDGWIDEVIKTTPKNSSEIVVSVRVIQYKTPNVGDKLTSKYAQKATIGVVVPEEDMPFNPLTGERVDAVFNPMGMPSRMTIGQLIDMLVGKAHVLIGERVNGTSFQKVNLRNAMNIMQRYSKYGYRRLGKEQLYSGMTGEPLPLDLYVGDTFYQSLPHHSESKLQARAKIGAMKPGIGQPTGGRNRGGAQKIGRMEASALGSHGGTDLTIERMCISSDAKNMVFCTACSNIATVDKRSNKLFCDNCKSTEKLGKCVLPNVLNYFRNLTAALGMGFNIKFREPEPGEIITGLVGTTEDVNEEPADIIFEGEDDIYESESEDYEYSEDY